MADSIKIGRFIKQDIGLWPFIFGLIVSCKVLGFYVGPIDVICYGLYGVMALILLTKANGFDNLSVCFLGCLAVSILVGAPNPIFKSWYRLGLFACIFICVSPMIMGRNAQKFRRGVFYTVIIACTLISAVSFVGYFAGINYMRSVYDGSVVDYLNNRGGTFGGITSHSMLLGPISGVGAIACLHLALKKRRIFWLLFVMCFGAVLFAASRSALVATLVGCLIYFAFSAKKIGKNLMILIGITILAIASYPLWDNALAGIEKKNEGSIAEGVRMDSRNQKWEIRMEEWESSPICGIGFCAVSDKDAYTLDGKIEPGSSWLAVLSMTGIIGFVLFCCLYFRACKHVLQPHTSEGALIGAVLVLLGVHMIAEGHIFSAGSYLCFLVWLAIGRATDYRPSEQLRFTK